MKIIFLQATAEKSVETNAKAVAAASRMKITVG